MTRTRQLLTCHLGDGANGDPHCVHALRNYSPSRVIIARSRSPSLILFSLGLMLAVRLKTAIVRTIAAVVVLLVAGSLVGAAALWHTAAIPAMGPAPCDDCSAVYASGDVVAADVCALGASLESFRDQLVRVRGAFVHDSCYTSLRCDSCPSDFVRVGISRDIAGCSGTQKALAIQTGFGQWYDGPPVAATVVGRIREIQNQGSCNRDQIGLDVLCLESVTPIYAVAESRVKYAVGRVLDFIFGIPKT